MPFLALLVAAALAQDPAPPPKAKDTEQQVRPTEQMAQKLDAEIEALEQLLGVRPVRVVSNVQDAGHQAPVVKPEAVETTKGMTETVTPAEEPVAAEPGGPTPTR